ncbi:MAG: hydrogenase assembly protein HypC [Chloroflexi bacterium]|nr:MAG: hydrogenase assembly protein HypC [Chloroflexota bacterium]
MCLVLPSRVVALGDNQLEVELADGQRAMVDATLKPDFSVGDYVLVDRGIVVDSIAADEAQVILSMYREIGELLEAEDARA